MRITALVAASVAALALAACTPAADKAEEAPAADAAAEAPAADAAMAPAADAAAPAADAAAAPAADARPPLTNTSDIIRAFGSDEGRAVPEGAALFRCPVRCAPPNVGAI